MRLSTIRIVAVCGIAALALLAWRAAPAATPEPGAGYTVELDIVPDDSHPGAFQARATVTDLGTGEIVSRPRVVFPRGAGGGQMRTGTSDGLSVGIHVEVDERGESASCQTEIWRDEVLVSAHKVRIRLAGEEPAE